MKFLLQKFRGSATLKDSLVLIGGTAVAQLIPILAQLILRRYYAPSMYGELSVYASVMGMFAGISCGKLETALVIPKEDDEGSELFFSSIVVNAFYHLFFFLIIILFSTKINLFVGLPVDSVILFFVPLGGFLFSFSRALNYWLIRKSAFKAITVNKLARRFFETVFQFSFLTSPKSSFLILGTQIGDVANNYTAIRQSIKKNLKLQIYSGVVFRKILGKYRNFITVSAIPSWLNSVSLLLPVLIVNSKFTTGVTGNFDLSRQVLAVPLALVSVSLSQLSLNRFSLLLREEKSITGYFTKVLVFLSIVTGIGIVLFYFTSDYLFNAFGNSWGLASELSKVLVFSYAIKFVVSPLTSYYTASQQLKLFAVWQILYFFGIVLLYLMDFESVQQFILFYTILDVCFYSLNLILLLKLVYGRKNFK